MVTYFLLISCLVINSVRSLNLVENSIVERMVKSHELFVNFVFNDAYQILQPNILIDSKGIFKPIDPDVYKTPFDIITDKGYSLEIHKILTNDSYILTAWRITKNITHNYPVILQHGLLDCSFTWILNEENSLPFILANMGYDVWVTNSRGNRYSNEHEYLNPIINYDEYWSFSWDQMGKYDIPATIGYIQNVTSIKKVHYIGHSQGTTILFAKIALDPSFKKNIQSFVGLGPIAFLSHEAKIIPFLMKIGVIKCLIDGLNDINDEAILVQKSLITPDLGYVCYICPKLCTDVLMDIAGYTKVVHLNSSRLPVMASHEPGGTSLQNLAHWAQASIDANFQMYDYGSAVQNLAAYGTETAPDYNITNWGEFNVPTYFIQGANDTLSVYADLENTVSYFPKGIIDVEIIQDYNHLDYIWSESAYLDIYPKIISFLQVNDNEDQVFLNDS